MLKRLGQQAGFKQVKFRIKSKIFLLDYDGNLPAYVHISNGKTANNKGACDIPLLAGSVIVADRFYNDFSLLHVWESSGVWFVIRHKENLQYRTLTENELPENRHEHILKDELIELTDIKSRKIYPAKLPRVAVWDEQNQQVIEFITNPRTWTKTPSASYTKAVGRSNCSSNGLNNTCESKRFMGKP